MDPTRKGKRMVVALAALMAGADHYLKRLVKNPEKTSALSGNDHVLELLEGNPLRFKSAGRMEKDVFESLVEEIRARGLLHEEKQEEKYPFCQNLE